MWYSALLGAVVNFISGWAFNLLVGLGIGFVSYKGITIAFDVLKANVVNGTTGLPVDVLNLLGYLWVDKAIGMIIAAYASITQIWLAGFGFKQMYFKK